MTVNNTDEAIAALLKAGRNHQTLIGWLRDRHVEQEERITQLEEQVKTLTAQPHPVTYDGIPVSKWNPPGEIGATNNTKGMTEDLRKGWSYLPPGQF